MLSSFIFDLLKKCICKERIFSSKPPWPVSAARSWPWCPVSLRCSCRRRCWGWRQPGTWGWSEGCTWSLPAGGGQSRITSPGSACPHTRSHWSKRRGWRKLRSLKVCRGTSASSWCLEARTGTVGRMGTVQLFTSNFLSQLMSLIPSLTASFTTLVWSCSS